MSKENNKIYFTNSPFANGHKIVDFVWNARLDENWKIIMDLHLESDQYDEEDEYEDIIEEIDNITLQNTEKSLWINYDHCIISSIFWDNKGIEIDLSEGEFDLKNLNNNTINLDQLPVDLDKPEEEFAFGISMLGKDTAANHEITFLDTEEFGFFDVKWKGKVANTYLGEKEFDYDFYAYMNRIKFGGIKIHPDLDMQQVDNFLKENLVDYNEFEMVETDELKLEKYIFRLKSK